MSDFKPVPPLPDLRIGDVLLYSPSDFIGLIIATKTWTWLSHVEVYIGNGRVIAARTKGINIYSERVDKNLVCIRRPRTEHFDSTNAYSAVQNMIGKPYPVGGLFAFFASWQVKHQASVVCSGVVTDYLRGGGCEPFNPAVQDEKVSPSMLWQTDELVTIWGK